MSLSGWSWTVVIKAVVNIFIVSKVSNNRMSDGEQRKTKKQ